MEKTYSLAFLCWVNRCLYPDTTADELREFGISDADYAMIKMRSGPFDILEIYQDYCVGSGKGSTLHKGIDAWLEMMHDKWKL